MISLLSLDKRRQPRLELGISGKYRVYYLWLLTQSYTAIPKDLWRQAGQGHICVVPEIKGRSKMIRDENNVLTDDELVVARNF